MAKYSQEQIIEWAREYEREKGYWPTAFALQHWIRRRRKAGDGAPSAGTVAKALAAYEGKRETPDTSGPRAGDQYPDPEAALRAVLEAQKAAVRQAEARRRAKVRFGDAPVVIAFLSDLHFGSRGTDYVAAFDDAEVVASTPGMYAVFHGDGIDNFIVGRLERARRSAPVPLDEEWAIFKAWLDRIHDKLIVAVSGNHDSWTWAMGGVDVLKGLLPRLTLYDRNEVLVGFEVGGHVWSTLIRHKTRFNSVYNPLHGIKQTVRFHSASPDIAVAGHVHRGAMYELWYHHGTQRVAVLTGTYKKNDEYALQEGFVSGGGRGTAVAVLITPEGQVQPFADLKLAAEVLKYLRKER